MTKLVVVRHGQSLWNLENKFTGWTDVDLSEKGIEEAKSAGLLLKEKNYTFDVAYTSKLLRANRTLNIILDELNVKVPIHYSYKLNERHYGGLQGLNKSDAAKEFGAEQVKLWRRSYDVRPPKSNIPNINEPNGESLKDTYYRVKDYYIKTIKHELKNQKNVLIVAHGNSLRALAKYLLDLSDDAIIDFEIPTGKPLVFELNDKLKVEKYYYL
ncbi:MAG: 2,3-bisphosphoglycerate-dependent phosphoglycerate mutase [Acholeplasma sp.]|nr:2,3-bisphosphoglycerate-dependent phosphoglycerate mutase [Acholeplasma sp.]